MVYYFHELYHQGNCFRESFSYNIRGACLFLTSTWGEGAYNIPPKICHLAQGLFFKWRQLISTDKEAFSVLLYLIKGKESISFCKNGIDSPIPSCMRKKRAAFIPGDRDLPWYKSVYISLTETILTPPKCPSHLHTFYYLLLAWYMNHSLQPLLWLSLPSCESLVQIKTATSVKSVCLFSC
jgi:hypothetical protein